MNVNQAILHLVALPLAATDTVSYELCTLTPPPPHLFFPSSIHMSCGNFRNSSKESHDDPNYPRVPPLLFTQPQRRHDDHHPFLAERRLWGQTRLCLTIYHHINMDCVFAEATSAVCRDTWKESSNNIIANRLIKPSQRHENCVKRAAARTSPGLSSFNSAVT